MNKYPFELRASKINGVGIFSLENFNVGSDISQYVLEDAILISVPPDLEFAKHWGIKTENGWWLPEDARQMSMWWYMNHSNEPNVDIENNRYIILKEIKIGDEMTGDYRKLDEKVDNLEFRGIKEKQTP